MPSLFLFFHLYLFLFMASSCSAQQPVYANTDVPKPRPKLVRSQGSSQYANVYCALKDRSGNLWFGTMGEGVYRYDGLGFTQFTEKDGLSNNYVYALMQDKKGDIWLGTAHGLCRYNGNSFIKVPIMIAGTRSAPPYLLPDKPFTKNMYGVPAMDNTVWSLMQDSKGIYWFGATTGVYRYDGISFTRFTEMFGLANTDSVRLNMVDCMLEDRNGDVWFCSGMLPGNEGIFRYDGQSIQQFKPYKETWVHQVVAGKNGDLYFATRHNGVLRYDGRQFTNITQQAGIDNGSVDRILPDRSGKFWMGTELDSGEIGEEGGLWCYDGQSFTHYSTRDGLVHNGVFCLVEDNDGNTWIGTRNMGLCRYDGKTFTRFSE